MDRTGQVIGVWSLDQLIGRGGMGEVYRAHRIDGVVEKEAAIKILRSTAPDSPDREAATLRSISHKNIVQYLDSGTTTDNHPYLAMEYIDGIPITEYADQKGLSILERLSLFLQVCDAISFAHLYLILHLDLKPANILVRKDNVVRIVDFGIARRLDDDIKETLDGWSGPYASPEQIQPGVRLGCATDIYGLGATLYELLSGHEPFNPYLMPGELERQIAEETPRAPSDAINQPKLCSVENGKYFRVEPEAIARMRGDCGFPEVRSLLVGSLDRICLFALRKEPARRYKTVDQLRSDIEKVLKRLPPEYAHSNDLGYLAWRTAQRRPLAVAAIIFSIAVTYSQHLVSDYSASSRRTSLETKLKTDQVVESTLKQLTEELRPGLVSDSRPRGSLEVLDAELKAAAAKRPRTANEEIKHDGIGIFERLKRIIPGNALSNMP
jgi:serine/threonine-protein kinase